MAYESKATSLTPQLIILLLDVSGSMGLPFGSSTRIAAVTRAVRGMQQQMLNTSTKDVGVSDRYHIALFTYSTKSIDVLKGVKTLNEFVKLGTPVLATVEKTDTALAFQHVEKFLTGLLPTYELNRQYARPAPLVCHITDGEYTAADPEPVARRIMQMSVKDGPVLVENIFITDDVLVEPIGNLKEWPGVTAATRLKTPYAEKLRAMSSPLPLNYLSNMREHGYRLDPGAVMLFPGHTPELLRLGMQVTIATGMLLGAT